MVFQLRDEVSLFGSNANERVAAFTFRPHVGSIWDFVFHARTGPRHLPSLKSWLAPAAQFRQKLFLIFQARINPLGLNSLADCFLYFRC